MAISRENGGRMSSAKPNDKSVHSSVRTFFNQLRARKMMGQLQAEIDTENALRRALNWIQLTGIGLGGIIGEDD